MNSKVLLVVVLLIVGAAGWWFLRGEVDVAPPSAPPAAATGAGAPATAATAEVATGGVQRLQNDASQSDRTAAPASVEPGKTPRPTASIRGRIVDSQHRPRPGVELTFATWALPDGLDFGGAPVPPRGDLAADAKRPVVVTKEDGTFVVSLAADRVGNLGLRTDDLVFANELPQLDGKKGDQDLGDLVAMKGGALQGVVKDEHGRPVPGVKVGATLGAALGAFGLGTTSAGVSDQDGAFSVGKLRAGAWHVRTASDRFQPTTQEVVLQPEERRTDLVIVVRPGQAIAGQVVDDLGMPVANCKVASKRREVRGSVDIERFTTDEAATTDAGGYFTLSGLTGETATVRAVSKGHTTAVAKDVRVGAGDLVLRVSRLAEVRGVLVGMDNAPIAGSRVSAVDAARPGSPGFAESGVDGMDFGRFDAATTGDDGSFHVRGVKPGTVTIVAEGKGHRPASCRNLEVAPGQIVENVRITAPTGATVKVEVVDPAGRPVAKAKVRVKRPDAPDVRNGGRFVRAHRVEATADEEMDGNVSVSFGPQDELGSATTDENGIAVVKGLPAGDAVVAASHDTHADAEAAKVSLPATGTVETKLTMRVPGFAEVHVVSRDGTNVADCSFTLRSDAGTEQQETTDANGVARVGLAPGDYTAFLVQSNPADRGPGVVMVMNQDSAAMKGTKREFRVVAGETVRVDIERPVLTRVFGTVTGSDGPVPGCSVTLGADGADELPFALAGSGSRTATTDGSGAFSITDVESGSYVLRYGKSSQMVKSKVAIDVPADTAELRRDLELRTGKIRVQVLAKENGDPVANASVEIEAAADKPADGVRREGPRMMMMTIMNDDQGGGGTTSMTMGGAPRAVTGPDGVAEIDDVPTGVYTVNVRHDKFAPTELTGQTVVERRVTDLGRVQLDAAGTIRGKVANADGSPAPFALVQCRAADTQDWGQPEVAPNGSFRFTGRKAGKHFVRTLGMGDGPNRTGPEVEVTVTAGDTATTEVRLPAK